MKTILFLISFTCLVMLVALLFVGCNISRQVNSLQIPTQTTLPSKVAATIPPTLILNSAINTPSFSPSITASPYLDPTSIVTNTPQPTLSSQEAEAFILQLLTTNKNCRLPCWWGITPGETDWEEARGFLETFVTQVLTLRENIYGISYKNQGEASSNISISATIAVENGIVQTVRTGLYYPLTELLQEHGQPDEVRIFADVQSINPEVPYELALYYKSKGILAVYKGTTEKAEVLKICPSSLSDDRNLWFLWNPSLNISFESAGYEALLLTFPSIKRFLDLEDGTNIDVKTFFETYRNIETESICFEMPAIQK